MEHKLSELIHNCTSNTTNSITAAIYSSLYGLRSKFNVPVSKFGDFIDGYCQLAYEDVNMDEGDGIAPMELCIGEVVDTKSTLPLMGIFNFKFHVEEGEEERSYYGEDMPMRLVKCYQKAMTDLLEISSNMSEYLCCIQEGHSYRKGDYVRINLVLQFPFCQVDYKFLKRIFRPYVEKLLRSNRVIESFDTQPVGDWHEILSDPEGVIPMYRSVTETGIPHMALTHVYELVDDSHIDALEGPELELKKFFVPSSHSFIYNGKVPRATVPLEPAEDEDEDEFIKYWIPLFLSIHFWGGQTNPKETEKTLEDNRKGVYEVDDGDSEHPLKMIRSLLPLLSTDRANKDYSWLDVGRVLHQATRGGEEGLNIWVKFSSRATVPGRDKSMCTYKYSEFRNCLLTAKTIAWYAKQDNPTGYDEWHQAWCQRSLNDGLSGLHADVAKAIYRVFWLEYVYSVDTCNWYQYRENHFYKIGKEPTPLRKAILSKFIPIYEKMRMELTKNSYENTNSEDPMKKEAEYKIKSITELNKKIKNENYRSTILRAIKEFFDVEEFEKKCDRNHFLTATANCVLEVVDKRVRPRLGKPEDFILKYSEIMFPFDYTWEHYWVKEMMHWLDQICVRDAGLKHYFLKRMASFLRGLNPEKLFDVWTSSGNNSKSMLAKTLQFIFGAYFIDFPTSLLTGGNGKNSSGPSPELAQAANARGAILAEPDDREQMKGGIIKRITGGDRIFTRALNENGGSMELTFKTIMVCNRIPDIANVDKALINRFAIMPFLGTWSDSAPESEEEQFKMKTFKLDPFFEAKIPELGRALLWIMVQYYHFYEVEKLAFPPVVVDYIKKHWEDNDYYLQFIAEKIEYAYKDTDKKDIDIGVTLSVQEMYPIFNRWFRDYYPGIPSPTASQFKSDLEMVNRLGPQPKKQQWLGIRLKQSALIPDLGGIKI